MKWPWRRVSGGPDAVVRTGSGRTYFPGCPNGEARALETLLRMVDEGNLPASQRPCQGHPPVEVKVEITGDVYAKSDVEFETMLAEAIRKLKQKGRLPR